MTCCCHRVDIPLGRSVILWGKYAETIILKFKFSFLKMFFLAQLIFITTPYLKNKIIKLIFTYFNIVLLVKGSRKLYKHSQI